MGAAGPQAGAAADHLPEMTATDKGEPATCSAFANALPKRPAYELYHTVM